MHERRSSDPTPLLKGHSKPEVRMAAVNGPGAAAKATSFRQCKSLSSKDSGSLASKIPKCSEASKVSACDSGKVDDARSTVVNPAQTGKFDGKTEAMHLSKPAPVRQNGAARPDGAQPASNRSNDSAGAAAAGISKTSSTPSDGSVRRATREDGDSKSATSKGAPTRAAKEISPKPVAPVRSLSLSLNTDPQKKLPPIKTGNTASFKSPSAAKATANLCSECKAEAEGAVCFIGNDGRVSACTSRNAVRLCKNLKCANHNPELADFHSTAAAKAGPKKYLISRRHSLNLRSRSTAPNSKNGQPVPDKVDAPSLHESPIGPVTAVITDHGEDDDLNGCNDPDAKGELEDDAESQEDFSAKIAEMEGAASASPRGGRSIGQYQRMRRRSFNVIETHAPAELVILRKQLMQERKQSEEWMLDFAIEEALQKLVPSKDSKVKALVEAFESIMPNKEVETGTAAGCDRPSETPKARSHMAINA